MGAYLIRRILQVIPVFIGTTLLVYWLMFAGSTDPLQALAGERPVTPAERLVLEDRFNLNDPFILQYLKYLGRLLTGDLGEQLNGRDISNVLATAWPITIRLAIVAFTFQVVFGIIAGLIAGMRRKGIFDTTVLISTLVVISIPVFVLGSTLQFVFGVQFRVFPVAVGGEATWYELLLPGIVLGALGLATTARLTRTSIAENLRMDYVRTARSKGLSIPRVVGVHVLRNSLIPVVTFLGAGLGDLMAGAIVTESIFNIPGVGFQIRQGIRAEDGPTVVTIVSILVLVYLIANLVVDVLYAVLDPRIRYD